MTAPVRVRSGLLAPRSTSLGCLVSVLVCVVGFLGAAALIFVGIVQVAAGVADMPSMPVGETRTVVLPRPGTYFLYYSTGDTSSHGLTSGDPQVSITGPNGDAVPVIATPDNGNGPIGSFEARLFGRFVAVSDGEYAVRASAPPGAIGAGLSVRIGDEPVENDLSGFVVAAFILGFISLLAALALAIAWPLRLLREAKREPTEPGEPVPSIDPGAPPPPAAPPPPPPPGESAEPTEVAP